MNTIQQRIAELLERLNTVARQQQELFRETEQIRHELNDLRSSGSAQKEPPTETTMTDAHTGFLNQSTPPSRPQHEAAPPYKPWQTHMEKFIGENLLNKIGIVIVVMGVFIGVKYAIDHQLIQPITRIVLGYFLGLGLLVTALLLKKKYHGYSAVLLSGGSAAFYFTSYAAATLYALLPLPLVFVLMVVITAFTVVAALHYNQQIIAHVGMVGAYAVPFLLDTGSGNFVLLFAYMALINLGIVVIAFKRFWRSLHYTSFAFTWITIAGWSLSGYHSEKHLALALVFLTVFFILFYTAFLSYKLLRKTPFAVSDVLLLLSNAFIYFGLSYYVLSLHSNGEPWLGAVTVAHAAVHCAVAAWLLRKGSVDKVVFYPIVGLVIVFVTLAIPVQWDGPAIATLWSVEAALFFWLARQKSIAGYEAPSHVLMILSLISMWGDWKKHAAPLSEVPDAVAFFNGSFFSSLVFSASACFIVQLNRKHISVAGWTQHLLAQKVLPIWLALIALVGLYFTGNSEIHFAWNKAYIASAYTTDVSYSSTPLTQYNHDLILFRDLTVLLYGVVFLSVFAFLNVRYFRKELLRKTLSVLLTISLLAICVVGLFKLGELRESYMLPSHLQTYPVGMMHLAMRYIVFSVVAWGLWALKRYLYPPLVSKRQALHFHLVLHGVLLWILSAEWLHWTALLSWPFSDGVSLSILWALYALSLVMYGIIHPRKHLRVMGIVLLGATLVKLFLLDMAHQSTVSKTILLLSIGTVLLIASFFYNKYTIDPSDNV